MKTNTETKTRASRKHWLVAIPLAAVLAGGGIVLAGQIQGQGTHMCRVGMLCDTNASSQNSSNDVTQRDNGQDASYRLGNTSANFIDAQADQSVKGTHATLSGGIGKHGQPYAQVKFKKSFLAAAGKKVWFHYNGKVVTARANILGVAKVTLKPLKGEKTIDVTAFYGKDNGTPVKTATGATVLTVPVR